MFKEFYGKYLSPVGLSFALSAYGYNTNRYNRFPNAEWFSESIMMGQLSLLVGTVLFLKPSGLNCFISCHILPCAYLLWSQHPRDPTMTYGGAPTSGCVVWPKTGRKAESQRSHHSCSHPWVLWQSKKQGEPAARECPYAGTPTLLLCPLKIVLADCNSLVLWFTASCSHGERSKGARPMLWQIQLQAWE